MANWSNDPINEGYTIVNGALTGTAASKIACWLEYKVLSQSVENNTSLIRFYVYLATAQNTNNYHLYANNNSGNSRGYMQATADGSEVYLRTKRGFATAMIPTRTNHTTQYETAFGASEDTRFLTILTDNAETKADAYGECTVSHDTDGTKTVTLAFSADCSVTSSIGTVSAAISIQLPTIARATTPTVGDVTLGEAAVITLAPASASFRHTLRAKFGDRAETTIVSRTSATSTSWTPALAEANAAPNATTVVGTLYCDTYSGNTLIGTKTLTIAAAIAESVVPSCGCSISEYDANIYAQFGAFVQKKSKLAVALTPIGAYGSAISSISCTVNGTTYTENSFTTAELKNAGTQTMRIVVKDSRKRSSMIDVSYAVLAYAEPKLTNLSVYRCNANGVTSHTGQYIAVTLKGTISSVNDLNTHSFTVGWKRKSATSYTTQTLSVSGYTVNDTFILGGSLSSQYAYDIRIGATDFFSTTYAYSDISTSDTILSIRNSGLGLAIGKISEENLFEVGWDAKFHEDTQFIGNATFTVLTGLMNAIFPIGSIRMTTSATDQSTFMGGTWELWGSGRVPVGVDTTDTDFKTANKTGGAKAVALTTTQLPAHSHALSGLTISEAGAHTHVASAGSYKVGSGSGSSYKYLTNGGTTDGQLTDEAGAHTHTLSGSVGSTGSGNTHSNLQPYITCYFWRRTA